MEREIGASEVRFLAREGVIDQPAVKLGIAAIEAAEIVVGPQQDQTEFAHS